jgi:hypothetical protein
METIVVQEAEAAERSEPDSTGAGLEDREDLEAGLYLEPNTIKTDEARLGAKEEVTLTALGNTENAILWKTMLVPPCVMHVVGWSGLRVEGIGEGRVAEDDEE